MPPNMKLPLVMQRAADARPESRIVIGGVGDATERLVAYRDAIGLNLFIASAAGVRYE